MHKFTHLHAHTHYSLLDGAASIPKLIKKVKESGMTAIAITDHGNMFGVKEFHIAAKKEGIKPILGCEVYVAKESRFRQDKEKDKKSDHLILLAKNEIGYKNLIKLVTAGFTQGLYRKPRIDMDLLQEYSAGLIASSACIAGAIPRDILKNDIIAAEKKAKQFQDIFGDDFYLEMQRHDSGNPETTNKVLELQDKVNKEIFKISQKLGIKFIATNDVHFVEQEDAVSHDVLIALSTGKDLDDPTRIKYSGEEYLKSPQQMFDLFAEYPEAISNTQEITEKIEDYELDKNPLMPEFVLPENVENESEYLKFVTYEGAKKRWTLLTDEIKERLDFELNTIIRMEFPGYFLIVWDFLNAARNMGVSVGPGRGSAAGSAVAYCLKITDIDPIKYGLLFERFLNPDRISMPDIDIDFDEDGREKVLQWVINKYGEKRVANIITFGSMAAKSAIRDVARVLKLPLNESDRLAKLIPDKPGITFNSAFEEVPELKKEKNSNNPLIRKTLELAVKLEGTVRHTGVHACGIIIGKDDLENHIPLCTAKDSDLKVTQYDGKHVESTGLMKMDFLGLKTLSIITDTIKNIKYSKNEEIDIDNISYDDKKTFELFSKGETTAVFQFESAAMKQHLRSLKPNRFEDLIAMNALYRPGPMDYISEFIDRKQGRHKISYDYPEMEEFLKETYGITVYQEQVMLLSQKLAGFTKGEADSLRKAIGKKIQYMMDELKPKFINGCQINNHDKKTAEKIWGHWEKFASYAFNKSHSTCYAYVAYRTAYLKANYPAEFMSAVLGRNLNDIKKVSVFLNEAKRMGLDVLLPDVNESFSSFTVNKKGQIVYGLGGVKNVGSSAVDDIVKERKKNGKFKSFVDFVERVNLSSVNKRTIEALVVAGAFEKIDNIKRSQYFASVNQGEQTFIEECIRYGGKFQNGGEENQTSIFGTEAIEIKKPEPPIIEEWGRLERLKREKEIIGIYFSEHPLDDYKLEIKTYCNATVEELTDLTKLKGKDLFFAGIISSFSHRISKSGNAFGTFVLEGYRDFLEIRLFQKEYIAFKNYFIQDLQVLIHGRVQQRKFSDSENDLELKIVNIELLSEAKNKMIKSLTITIPVEEISDRFMNAFQKIIEKHKGKTIINFNIVEREKGFSLNLFSRSRSVKVNNQLISELNNLVEINYSLN